MELCREGVAMGGGRGSALPCIALHYPAIPCNTLHYHTLPYTTIHYHTLIFLRFPGVSCPEELLELPHLHEASVIWGLERRFHIDKIYTWLGPELLVFNPFKTIHPLYTKEQISKQIRRKFTAEENHDPHVYALTMKAVGDDQSMYSHGNSGWGLHGEVLHGSRDRALRRNFKKNSGISLLVHSARRTKSCSKQFSKNTLLLQSINQSKTVSAQ